MRKSRSQTAKKTKNGALRNGNDLDLMKELPERDRNDMTCGECNVMGNNSRFEKGRVVTHSITTITELDVLKVQYGIRGRCGCLFGKTNSTRRAILI